MENEIISHLSSVGDLPCLPEIVTRLTRAVEDPAMNAANIARIISDDPVVTAKVLRVVNSAYYARGVGAHEVSSVPHAVARMGFREVKNIVLTLSAFDLFESKNSAVNLKNFWCHSVLTAITTRYVHNFSNDGHLADEGDLDAYFVAGLLHDIGILVLNQYFKPQLIEILNETKYSDRSLYDIEVGILGVDHAVVGGFVARSWNLPDKVCGAIENHHSPEKAPEAMVRIARVVNLADYLCQLHGPFYGPMGSTGEEKTHLQSLKALGVPVKLLSEIMDIVEEEASRSEVLIALNP